MRLYALLSSLYLYEFSPHLRRKKLNYDSTFSWFALIFIRETLLQLESLGILLWHPPIHEATLHIIWTWAFSKTFVPFSCYFIIFFCTCILTYYSVFNNNLLIPLAGMMSILHFQAPYITRPFPHLTPFVLSKCYYNASSEGYIIFIFAIL